MKMHRFAGVLLALTLTLLSGCAVNRSTATVDPTTNLAAIKSVYVVHVPEDDRNINELIVTRLNQLGMTATTGGTTPKDVDAVVTYIDRWMWDITMYMLDLTVVVRDPKTDFPLATGNSHHTSLTRLSPKEMVDEVIGNIWKGGKK